MFRHTEVKKCFCTTAPKLKDLVFKGYVRSVILYGKEVQ